jgi:hypothetical protein
LRSPLASTKCRPQRPCASIDALESRRCHGPRSCEHPATGVEALALSSATSPWRGPHQPASNTGFGSTRVDGELVSSSVFEGDGLGKVTVGRVSDVIQVIRRVGVVADEVKIAVDALRVGIASNGSAPGTELRTLDTSTLEVAILDASRPRRIPASALEALLPALEAQPKPESDAD